MPNRAGRRAADIALSLMALFTPWLALVSDRAMAWLIAPCAAGLLFAWIADRGGTGRNPVSLPALLTAGGLAAVTGLAMLSPLWGDPGFHENMTKLAWRAAPALIVGIALMLAAGAVATDGRALRRWLAIGCAIAVAITFVDLFSDHWLLSLRRAAADGGVTADLADRAALLKPEDYLAKFNDFWMLASMCLGLLAMTVRRVWAFPAMLIALGALSTLTISETSLIMAFAGLVATGLVLAFGRLAVKGVMAAVIAAIATAPWLFPLLDRGVGAVLDGGSLLTHKIRERTEIWAALAKTVPERFWLGHGIGHQRFIRDYPGPREFFIPDTIWHPHSVFVQIWQDLGLAGAAMLCVAVAGLFMAILRAPADKQPALTALVVMVLAALGAAHSIWLGWWLCSFFMVAAMAMVIARPREAR